MPRKLPPHLKGPGMPGPQACAAAPLGMALQGGVLTPPRRPEGRPPYTPLQTQYVGRGDLTLPRGVGDAAPYSKTPIGATSDGGHFLQITA